MKSVFEHASLGIDDSSVRRGHAAVLRVLAERRAHYGGAWFAERYVPGRELNVAVIEYVYGIPGMFRVVYTVAKKGDVPVMEAMILEGVILIVLANLIADAVQYRLDPRLAQQRA